MLDSYLLDSVGCVTLRQVTPVALVHQARQLVETRVRTSKNVKFPFLDLNPDLFLRLINQPRIFNLCRDVLGPFFRLDHAFARVQPDSTGKEVPNLHGGPGSANGAHLFVSQAGNPYCAQLSVGIPLDSQGPSRGGVIYIPGSHKSRFCKHGREILSDMLKNNFNHECLACPSVVPGDVLVFPETLVHGAKPMGSKEPRVTLYYMFSPGHVCWRSEGAADMRCCLQAAQALGLQDLLLPAGVATYRENPEGNADNAMKQPTRVRYA